MLVILTMLLCKRVSSQKYDVAGAHVLVPFLRPCDSAFELILQFAGKNFTLAKEDILVPSYLAIDSLGIGGEADSNCQFQAQPDDPTEDEFGPYTSITYQFGDPLMRNVAMVSGYCTITGGKADFAMDILTGLRIWQCSRLNH